MGSSRTKLGKLGIGAADPVSFLLRFVEFDPGVRRELRTSRGTAGTFYTDSNLARESRQIAAPTFSGEPTAAELAELLAWGVGPGVGTPVVVYTPQNDVVGRNVHWKPEFGEEIFLPGVGMDTLTFSAGVGEPLAVSFDGVGTTHTDTRADFPALSPDVTSQMFMLSDVSAAGGVFTLGGVTRQPAGISIRISNFIDRNRYLSSLTLTRVQKLDMQFGVSFDMPSGDNSGAWKAGLADAGVSFVATFTNVSTGAVFTVTAACVKFPAQTPRHAAGGEGMTTVDGMAYRSGGTGHPMTFSLKL